MQLTKKNLFHLKDFLLFFCSAFLLLQSHAAFSQRSKADTSQKVLLASLSEKKEKEYLLKESNVVFPEILKGNEDEAMEYIEGFSNARKEYLVRMYKRGKILLPKTVAIFKKYDLPMELKHLAIIESQLNTKARSRVGAVGPWQFMATTARLLSLKVTAKYDERTHFYKSTVAAAKYLRDLHREFDDWLLVIAAYNCGPAPVYKAIKKSGSRNFWKLQQFLPEETRGHVKKFISTHYYYEGKGSVTTLTKQEADMHRKKMLAFAEKHNQLLKEKQAASIGENDSTTDNSSKEEKIVAKANTLVGLKPQE